MKNSKASRFGGFTLIELLVVVLIIGILAAVALPQYERAVFKSRYASMIPLIKTLASAQESYFMANGRYATDLAELDVTMPASFSPISTTSFSFGGTVYANADKSIYVGMVKNGNDVFGVQCIFPKKLVGYRVTLQNTGLSSTQKGKNFCVEVGAGVWNQYCPWIANNPQAVVENWHGRWYLMNS